MTTTEDVIKSAAAVARDAAEGRLSPEELDAAVADECKALFGVVGGPDDPLWPLHVDVTQQVLSAGGLSADEAAEWAAVLKRRAGGTATPDEVDSSASGPHSPDSSGPSGEIEPMNAVAAEDNTVADG